MSEFVVTALDSVVPQADHMADIAAQNEKAKDVAVEKKRAEDEKVELPPQICTSAEPPLTAYLLFLSIFPVDCACCSGVDPHPYLTELHHTSSSCADAGESGTGS